MITWTESVSTSFGGSTETSSQGRTISFTDTNSHTTVNSGSTQYSANNLQTQIHVSDVASASYGTAVTDFSSGDATGYSYTSLLGSSQVLGTQQFSSGQTGTTTTVGGGGTANTTSTSSTFGSTEVTITVSAATSRTITSAQTINAQTTTSTTSSFSYITASSVAGTVTTTSATSLYTNVSTTTTSTLETYTTLSSVSVTANNGEIAVATHYLPQGNEILWLYTGSTSKTGSIGLSDYLSFTGQTSVLPTNGGLISYAGATSTAVPVLSTVTGTITVTSLTTVSGTIDSVIVVSGSTFDSNFLGYNISTYSESTYSITTTGSTTTNSASTFPATGIYTFTFDGTANITETVTTFLGATTDNGLSIFSAYYATNTTTSSTTVLTSLSSYGVALAPFGGGTTNSTMTFASSGGFTISSSNLSPGAVSLQFAIATPILKQPNVGIRLDPQGPLFQRAGIGTDFNPGQLMSAIYSTDQNIPLNFPTGIVQKWYDSFFSVSYTAFFNSASSINITSASTYLAGTNTSTTSGSAITSWTGNDPVSETLFYIENEGLPRFDTGYYESSGSTVQNSMLLRAGVYLDSDSSSTTFIISNESNALLKTNTAADFYRQLPIATATPQGVIVETRGA